MFGYSWAYSLALVAIAFLTYAALLVIYRLYFHPLSSFPGPKLAAATLWYEFYYDVIKRGTFIWRLEELHKKYGKIIRINPHELHIDDPAYCDTIYASSSKKRDKYRWWVQLAGAPTSTFSTVEHDLHRFRRSALNPFFSKKSVLNLEPMIQSKVDKLCQRFEKAAATGTVVRLDAAYMAVTMDIITQYASSKSCDYLDREEFALAWKDTLFGALEMSALMRQCPWIYSLMKALPEKWVTAMEPQMALFFGWQKDVRGQVSAIMFKEREKDSDSFPTIFHTLLESDLPSEEKTLDRLSDEGEILIGAGSETTQQTLTKISWYLSQDRDIVQKLRKEVATAGLDPSLTRLEQLPGPDLSPIQPLW